MPDLGRSHVPPRKHPDILGDSRCPVIAALPFPDVEQDPAVVAGAQQSNVHTPMSHGQADGPARLVATSKDCGPSISEPWPPAAFPVGHAAGGGISHSQRPAGRMGRRPKPIAHGRPDQSPGGRTRPSHQSPPPRHPDRGDQRPRIRR